jgi:uncharacterized membrane protein YqiK
LVTAQEPTESIGPTTEAVAPAAPQVIGPDPMDEPLIPPDTTTYEAPTEQQPGITQSQPTSGDGHLLSSPTPAQQQQVPQQNPVDLWGAQRRQQAQAEALASQNADLKFQDELRAEQRAMDAQGWTMEQQDYHFQQRRGSYLAVKQAQEQSRQVAQQAEMAVYEQQAKVFTAMQLSRQYGGDYVSLMQAASAKEMESLAKTAYLERQLEKSRTSNTSSQKFAAGTAAAASSDDAFQRRFADPNYNPTPADFERMNRIAASLNS